MPGLWRLLCSKDADSAADDEGRSKFAQAVFLKIFQTLLKNTKDAGDGFAEQSWRMHYGDVPVRNICGSVGKHETAALLDEGINIAPQLLTPPH